MTFNITDEIIDAIIHNEGRYVARPGKQGTESGFSRTPGPIAPWQPSWSGFPARAPQLPIVDLTR